MCDYCSVYFAIGFYYVADDWRTIDDILGDENIKLNFKKIHGHSSVINFWIQTNKKKKQL